MARRERPKPIVVIEFTPGYEQRFTREILKILEKRESQEIEAELKNEKVDAG